MTIEPPPKAPTTGDGLRLAARYARRALRDQERREWYEALREALERVLADIAKARAVAKELLAEASRLRGQAHAARDRAAGVRVARNRRSR